jgi:hypothetical protein
MVYEKPDLSITAQEYYIYLRCLKRCYRSSNRCSWLMYRCLLRR